MQRLQRVAFRVGETSHRLAEAVILSAITGDWTEIEAEIQAGTRAQTQGPPASETDVAAALREFRYERQLISADEAREWLLLWELSAAEWKSAIERRLLRERGGASRDGAPPADEALAANLWPDLVCSGRLERLTRRLAEYAAIAGDDAAPVAAEPLPGRPLLPAWTGLTDTWRDPAVRRLMRLADAFETRRQRAISDDQVREAIASRLLDWTWVDSVRLAFPTEAMAAEAAFRVREDGETLADVAVAVGRPLENWSGFLDEAAASERMTLASAQDGDLLGPFPRDASHALFQVLHRRLPDESDPTVRAHAERRLWSAVTERALARVSWEGRPPRGPQ
jgi:hypothetical protein